MRAISILIAALMASGIAYTFYKYPPVQFGALTKQEIMADLAAAAELYYQQNGEYPQVPKNMNLLNKRLPEGWAVNNYSGPYGKGFTLIYEDDTQYEEWLYGPEQGLRPTIVRIKEPVVASTTPQ